ncbi:MAG: hypothetical protein COW01_00960 [Bdellovibrionales bacterium CG12_big_fil_rev_8_21_14_0_65_38_15]|nr:MAG: hypothetical protein COW79_05220 [Bdellovibrionales bacterium CG22_combo_CG10-13_8_21_14_all_38_13]PIQ57327.1 MAG: hypothetical protein COW01_00960 [Bdellovibrionales bacterium CG12_big_fil_rev_8_21_14_0_65_38_15]PIR28873.1 MAG: hypothetical protein COV38_13550 [Bdellovibrionales bacterium CG11_big_fil_rev_8_21_14_0_20_38_13]
MNRLIKNCQGQSTIEFIFSFSFAFFLIIYTLKVALNYTSGYMAHYATYMASRAYLTYENSGGGIDPAGLFSSVTEPIFNDTKVTFFNQNIIVDDTKLRITRAPILTGVTFDWETSFSSVGLFGGSQTLHFRSESFLGREPDRQECSIQTCQAARGGTSGRCEKAFTLADNGC